MCRGMKVSLGKRSRIETPSGCELANAFNALDPLGKSLRDARNLAPKRLLRYPAPDPPVHPAAVGRCHDRGPASVLLGRGESPAPSTTPGGEDDIFARPDGGPARRTSARGLRRAAHRTR